MMLEARHHTIARAFVVIRREVVLTGRAFAALPGNLAGRNGETAQVFAKNAAMMLLGQITMTVVLMIWFARVL
jgi:hypothetical protein